MQGLLEKLELKRGELKEQELICKSALKTNKELGEIVSSRSLEGG